MGPTKELGFTGLPSIPAKITGVCAEAYVTQTQTDNLEALGLGNLIQTRVRASVSEGEIPGISRTNTVLVAGRS